jgi:hypothetical protein
LAYTTIYVKKEEDPDINVRGSVSPPRREEEEGALAPMGLGQSGIRNIEGGRAA